MGSYWGPVRVVGPWVIILDSSAATTHKSWHQVRTQGLIATTARTGTLQVNSDQ